MGGGGSIPIPATTANNHHSPPPCSQNVSPSSSNLYTQSERELARGSCSKTIFGSAPSQTEVENVISDLPRVMDGLCTRNSEKNGVGTLMRSSGILQAIHLLQTNNIIQRLVASISLDKVVWDAMLNNKAVIHFLDLLPDTGTKENPMSYDQELNPTRGIIKWIFAFLGSKFMELIEKLEVFVNGALESNSKNGKSILELDAHLVEKVRYSLLLSIFVLFVVVITRIMAYYRSPI